MKEYTVELLMTHYEVEVVMTKKYELRSGKFGMYFYDTESNLDVDLERVLESLNRKEEYKKRLAIVNKKRPRSLGKEW